MLSEKYRADMRRLEFIGEDLSDRLHILYGTNGVFANVYALRVGVKTGTALTHIGEFCRGEMVFQLSDASSYHSRDLWLERMAVIYELLGVSQEGVLVEKMKTVNSMFTYTLF
jgi:hypothetical protein